MQRLILAIIVAAALSFVAGCGQSGPLYLPGNPSRIESLPPAPTGSEQDEDQEQEKKKSDSTS